MKPTVLLSLEIFYALGGALLAGVGGRIVGRRAHPRRWGSAAFWFLLAFVFAAGKWLPPLASGYLLLTMILLAAAKQVGAPAMADGRRSERVAEARRLGNRVFWPAVLVPAIALLGSRFVGKIHFGRVWLAGEQHATVISLALGAMVAILVGQRVLGARVATPAREGARLLETLGWTLILPQLLAALGGLFQRAGVGEVVADVTTRALPTQFPLVAVIAYCLGMAGFTVCMGNAFAAFAVITGGIGLPLVVQQHHGNPAIMAAIGMLSGYCGTLMTPMAANFNVVPALLLELPDRNAVIKAQVPIAVSLLAANVLLMYLLVYRF